jgi:hypothetical protein
MSHLAPFIAAQRDQGAERFPAPAPHFARSSLIAGSEASGTPSSPQTCWFNAGTYCEMLAESMDYY